MNLESILLLFPTATAGESTLLHSVLGHLPTVLLFVSCAIMPLTASVVGQLVKNPLAMWETSVRSLGWEDHLEKGKITHGRICTVHGVTKSSTH